MARIKYIMRTSNKYACTEKTHGYPSLAVLIKRNNQTSKRKKMENLPTHSVCNLGPAIRKLTNGNFATKMLSGTCRTTVLSITLLRNKTKQNYKSCLGVPDRESQNNLSSLIYLPAHAPGQPSRFHYSHRHGNGILSISPCNACCRESEPICEVDMCIQARASVVEALELRHQDIQFRCVHVTSIISISEHFF